MKHPALTDKNGGCIDIAQHPSKKAKLASAIPIYHHKGPAHNGKTSKITSRKKGL